MRQIADYLNRHQVPTFPNGKKSAQEWRAPRIGTILRDPTVLGYMQPCIRDGNGRKPVGQRVKLYPAPIDDAVWIAVRDALTSRRDGLRGRRGKDVANLFTGHVFCKSCGSSMRIETGGGLRKGRRRRSLVCARYAESKTCGDNEHYDMWKYEPPILHLLATHIAPVTQSDDEHRELIEQEAATRVEIENLQRVLDVLRPKLGISATLLEQFERTATELDQKRKLADNLAMRLGARNAPASRVQDLLVFLKKTIFPARAQDAEARERLRSLLSRFEFRIVSSLSSLMLTVGENTFRVTPHPLNAHMVYTVGENEAVKADNTYYVNRQPPA